MDYAFYVNEGATMLGNDYLDQYIDDWTVTQPHKNINTPLFNRADNHNGYPLQGPEFLRFINGPAIHPTGPEYLPEGYLRHGLDPWDILDSTTQGPISSTSSNSAKSYTSVAPLTFQFGNCSAPSQRAPDYYNRVHMSTRGSTPIFNKKHGHTHLQTDVMPSGHMHVHNVVMPITGKRNRKAQTVGDLDLHQKARPTKIARIDTRTKRSNPRCFLGSLPVLDGTNTSQPQTKQSSSHINSRQVTTCRLTSTQKKFIRQWYDAFAKGDSGSSLANEKVNALATLMQVTPQLVVEYIQLKFVVPFTTQAPKMPGPRFFTKPSSSSTPVYSMTEANQHLPAATLDMIQKYILACLRRRPQTDGRRRVNEGHFRCTYGCGYQTKRPFDWRRHEETHEPQELWLCHLCKQNQDQNPFLVNRRDKFLGHSKTSHKDWDPENVLNMSKLNFQAHFNPQCPLCPESLNTWDERCKHIQGHYEDGLLRGHRSGARRSKLSRSTETTSSEEDSTRTDSHDSTDASGDEDSDRDSPQFPDKRDPTGGSGGDPGTTSGRSTYRGGGSGQDSEHTEDTSPYGSYSCIGQAGNLRKAFSTRNAGSGETISMSEQMMRLKGVCVGGQEHPAGRKRPGITGHWPLTSFSLTQIQQLVHEERDLPCQSRASSHSRIEELDATDDGYVTTECLSRSSTLIPSQAEIPSGASIYGSTASSGQTPVTVKLGDEAEVEKERLEVFSSSSCKERESSGLPAHALTCTFVSFRKKRSFAFFGLNDILAEYESPIPSAALPNVVTDVYTLRLPPPAYTDSSLYPVYVSTARNMPRGSSQPQPWVHVAGMTGILGKVGKKRCHGIQHPTPPSPLAQSSCHRCGRRFVAPRLHQCRSCSHICCDKCTVVRLLPYSREVNDSVARDSHSQPPAYSFQDILGSVSTGDPLTELHTEETVLTPVIGASINLGNSDEERYIEEDVSTYAQVHSQGQDPDSSYSPPNSYKKSSYSKATTYQCQQQDFKSEVSTPTPSSPSSSASPQSQRIEFENHKESRRNRRENRGFISGRSKQSIHIKQPQAMNDYTSNPKLDCQDLTSRLQRVQRSSSVPNDGDCVARITRRGTGGTTSSVDSENTIFSRLPAFRKSKTCSSVGSNDVSRLEVVRTMPTSSINRESVEVEQGEFSKPSIQRRRASNESSKSHKEFHYYGRHANSWLFNDFSVSEHVKKGWDKVFSPKSEGEE